ncbi:hypothetical protein EV361DRAFT_874073 [Lentinula raphanica]|nr:hypothetical protein EV361DRAFT_874073 [Lentinula raphanica]
MIDVHNLKERSNQTVLLLTELYPYNISNTVALAIPKLNGSNYSKWKSTMTAYLCFSRAWGIVSGQNERLAETYSGSGSDHVETTSAELKKEIREWDEKDDAAIGIITLKLPKGL